MAWERGCNSTDPLYLASWHESTFFDFNVPDSTKEVKKNTYLFNYPFNFSCTTSTTLSDVRSAILFQTLSKDAALI